MNDKERRSWSIPILLFGEGEESTRVYLLCRKALGTECEYLPGDKEEMERCGVILLTRGKTYTGLEEVKQYLEEILKVKGRKI